MRIGLLVCDHVREQHLDIAGDYDQHFRDLFSGHPEVELVVYDVIGGEMPEDPAECDAWLTTGSRHSVNDDLSWIRQLEVFVRRIAKADVPFIGICFGHQLLARALGGTVGRSDRGWGVGNMDVATSDGSFRVMNLHQDQVESLPDGAEVLGWNEHCPISVMGVGSRMIGIQGHPEMPGEYTERILQERRGELIPEETAAAGLSSLAAGPDTGRLADWIVGFLKHSEPRRRHI